MTDALAKALADALIADPEALDALSAALAPHVKKHMEPSPPKILTTTQAARRAGLHERTIRRALDAQTLNGYTVAGRWRVQRDDLDIWVAAGAPTSMMAAVGNARRGRTQTEGAAAIRGELESRARALRDISGRVDG